MTRRRPAFLLAAGGVGPPPPAPPEGTQRLRGSSGNQTGSAENRHRGNAPQDFSASWQRLKFETFIKYYSERWLAFHFVEDDNNGDPQSHWIHRNILKAQFDILANEKIDNQYGGR